MKQPILLRMSMLLLFTLCMLVSFAQKVVTVEAEFTFPAPLNMSPIEAKAQALHQAKVKALADKFGTTISQVNSLYEKEKNGKLTDKFLSLSEDEVRGEWIETLGTPAYKLEMTDNALLVTVKVKGRARAIKHAAVNLSVKTLRNGTDDAFETTEFKDGDDIYLSFQSPINGYCLAYLVDEAQTAYCLLPYRNQTTGSFPVKANKHYVFFSEEKATDISPQIVDAYTLSAVDEREFNRLYVIFSPNEFAKAIDKSSSDLLPRETTFEAFQKWLSHCRKADEKMTVVVKNLVICK